MAAIDWIAARYKVDRTRLVIMGEGFGGYLAFRALQLHHDVFRCAIAVNAPTSLTAWASWKPLVTANPMYRAGDAEANAPIDFNSLVRGALVKAAKKTPNPPVAKADSKVTLHRGDVVTLVADPGALHVFNAATEQTLRRKEAR